MVKVKLVTFPVPSDYLRLAKGRAPRIPAEGVQLTTACQDQLDSDQLVQPLVSLLRRLAVREGSLPN